MKVAVGLFLWGEGGEDGGKEKRDLFGRQNEEDGCASGARSAITDYYLAINLQRIKVSTHTPTNTYTHTHTRARAPSNLHAPVSSCGI